jgi:hypothetical protein
MTDTVSPFNSYFYNSFMISYLIVTGVFSWNTKHLGSDVITFRLLLVIHKGQCHVSRPVQLVIKEIVNATEVGSLTSP